MPRSAIAAVAVWLVVSTAAAAPAQELTETVLLQRLDRSPAADALRRRVDEVRAESRARTVFPNPSIAYEREDAGPAADSFLLVRQSLPVTGELGFLRQSGAARVTAAGADAEWARQRLRADARLAFAGMLVAQAREAAILAALDDLEELVRVIGVRVREGESSAFDLRRAQREVADVRRALGLARVDRTRAAGVLRPFVPDVLGEAAVSGSLDAVEPPGLPALASPLTGRADYQAATALIDAWRLETRAAARQRLPQPAVTAGIARSTADGLSSTGYAFGIELRVPVFDRGGAATGLARSALARAETDRDALARRIDADVRTAHAVASELRRLALAYEQEVAGIGTELARVARAAYEEGEHGILELLDAYGAALDGTLGAIGLRGEARAALIDLDLAAGRVETAEGDR